MNDADALPDGPFQLEDLLAVQSNAIVSRTLLDGSGGTVTLFAMDGGQRISEHTAPHGALLQVLDGRVTVTIDGEDHGLETGETITLPTGVPHAVGAPVECTFLLTMVRPE